MLRPLLILVRLLNFTPMRAERRLFLPYRNFGSLLSPYTDRQRARVVILPVPYDSTTEWQSGTRDGPRAVIDASQHLELYDLELGLETYKVGIHTLPEVQPLMSGPEAMVQRVYEIAKELIGEGKLVVMLGGEHSLTLGMVKAYIDKFPDLCVLQLDAHADLRDEYMGSKYSHACIMRRLFEFCPIVQVGVRSLSWEEQQFLNQSGIRPFFISEKTLTSTSLKKIVLSLCENVYVTIDMDVFDPAVMPAVSNPEPGGLQWTEVINLLREVVSKRHIVGFDLTELCPGEGPISCAFLAAKLAYRLIGYIALREKGWEAL